MTLLDASLSGAALADAAHEPSSVLLEACSLPEIGSRLGDRRLAVDPTIDGLLAVGDETVRLHPTALTDAFRAAVVLREAVELLDLGAVTWPTRIVAHVVAGVYAITTLQTLRGDADLHDVTDTTLAAETLLGLPSDGVAGPDHRAIATAAAAFLRQRDHLPACRDDELDAAARALPLALPTEVLLTRGGDHRQRVDWTRLANGYGMSPRPAPWAVQLSSCTASAPTMAGFEVGRRAHARLVHAALDDRFDDAVATVTARLRRELLTALGCEPGGVDVVLTPSGTDAELVVLALAQRHGLPVHTIVVAPDEIGSGSPRAAAGQHFAAFTPFRASVTAGTPVAGLAPPGRSLVPVRDEDGHLRPPEAVEGDIERLVDRHAPDHLVLLHVVEGSKSGVRLPRPDAVARLQGRHGDRLQVMVDAAQMRIDQATAVAHLRRGATVVVTGSKFFGGPPFSGAVLVPADRAPWPGWQVPAGLADYLSRADLPAAWDGQQLPHPVNLALLLRWEVAVAEMRAFHNVSATVRDAVIRAVSAGIMRLLATNPRLEIVPSPYTDRSGDPASGLDDLPTIFTFLLRHEGRHLDLDEARELQQRLLRTGEPSTVGAGSVAVHLGQPIGIATAGGPVRGGLRIAIGAPTVSRVVFDHTRGPTWRHRVDRELHDVALALAKIEQVLDAWE